MVYGDGDTHGGGPTFADLFLATELGAQWTGHELSLADAATIAAVASAVIGPGAASGHQAGYLSDHPAFATGVAAPPTGSFDGGQQGRVLDMPGIARSETTVEVLVWPHGACDPQAEARKIAPRVGLRARMPAEINLNIPSFDREVRELMALGDTGLSQAEHGLPSGWYRGARGTTHVWRDFFRIPKSGLWGKPESFRTCVVLTGATWHFLPTDDYETRIALVVLSLKYVDSTAQWVYDMDEIHRYREHAEQLARGLERYLKDHAAPTASVETRKGMGAEATLPDTGA